MRHWSSARSLIIMRIHPITRATTEVQITDSILSNSSGAQTLISCISHINDIGEELRLEVSPSSPQARNKKDSTTLTYIKQKWCTKWNKPRRAQVKIYWSKRGPTPMNITYCSQIWKSNNRPHNAYNETEFTLQISTIEIDRHTSNQTDQNKEQASLTKRKPSKLISHQSQITAKAYMHQYSQPSKDRIEPET